MIEYNKTMKKKILVFLILIILSVSFFAIKETKAEPGDNVWGWAWSENIGWISFNSTSGGGPINYGVDIDTGTGLFSGYAWSENIGWISFEPADVNVADCPDWPASCQAELDLTTGAVSGWAKALAYGGGWDGWIGLSGIWEDGVSVISNPSPPPASVFNGWAWGNAVVGWISFNCSNTDYFPTVDYKVMTSVVLNDPPYVNFPSLIPDPEYCNSSPKASVFLQWTYNDSDGDSPDKYNLQVINNVTGAVVVDTGPVSLPTTTGTALVNVKQTPLDPLDIAYGGSYSWQVKVKAATGNLSWSGWESGSSFSTPSNPYPNPNFDWSPSSPPAEVEVSFDNTTEFYNAAVSYYWTFQDGSPADSWEFEPTVIFASSGPKTVTLTATDSYGYSCTETDTLTATLPLPTWKEIVPF